MQGLEQLAAEHAAVLDVLGHWDRAAALAAVGAPVPAALFTDMREFFAVFVNRCHQTKEEAVIFPALMAGAEALLIERLRAGHDAGRLLVGQVGTAVEAYRAGDEVTARRLAEAARAHSTFLRKHIALETAELFPAVERVLSTSDDQLVAAFERIERDEIGAGVHERLHSMMEHLPERLRAVAAAAPTLAGARWPRW